MRAGGGLVLAVLLAAGAALAQAPPVLDERAPPPAQVHFRGEALFSVYAPAQGLTPAQRAANIERRLNAVARGPEEQLAQIRTVEAGDASGIVAGDAVIAGFGDADARLARRTRQQLAADAAARVKDALARDLAARSSAALLRASLRAVAVTGVLLLLLYGLRRGTRSAQRRLRARLDASRARLPTHRQLLSVIHADELLLVGVRRLAFVLALVLTVLWLQRVLRLFPWTRGAAEAGKARLLGAAAWLVDGLVGFLPNLLYIALAVLVTRAVLRLLRVLAREVGSGHLSVPGFFPEWAPPTYKIARVFVVALCLVIVYPYLPGSGSDAFKGVSVFLGVLVSLGSTAAIANMVAGLVITYMRPFQLHDRIKIGDSEGEVIEKTLLVVRLRALDGMEITVPNSALLQGALQNYSAPLRRGLGLVVQSSVTIGYDVPWRTVEGLLLTAARATPGVVERPPPVVWQEELQDFYVKHTLRVAVEEIGQRKAILAALNQHILESFFAAGVEIMSPHFVAARDGNTAAIPPEQRPAVSEPAAFRHRVVAWDEARPVDGAPERTEASGRPAAERH